MGVKNLGWAAVLWVATSGCGLAQLSLEPLWSVPAISGTDAFPDTGSLTRGGAFNPATGNFLVATRVGGAGVRILDGATGASRGILDMTGVAGGTFALNMVVAGSDGAIYGANLVTDSSASPFRVYRWANESAIPTLVYSGNPGTGRYGDSLALRGGGALTEMVAGQGTTADGATRMLHLGTTDGATFAGRTLLVSGIGGGDLRLGLDFGPGNTVYAKQGTSPLRWVVYDLASSTAAVAASFEISTGGGLAGPLGVSGSVLVSYAYSRSTGPNTVGIYDRAALSASVTNAPVDTVNLTLTANSNGVGAVDFNADGSVVYVVAPNNGVHAYRVVPEPGTWALMGLGATLLALGAWRPVRRCRCSS